MPVEREHRRDVSARRMARQRDPPRVAAILRGMVARPFDGQRPILDERREACLRDQPVVGQNGDEAPAGERRAGKAIVAAVAIDPAAAVKEHHHRERRLVRAPRHPHVQFLPRLGTVGDALGGELGFAGRGQPIEAGEQSGGRARGEREKGREPGPSSRGSASAAVVHRAEVAARAPPRNRRLGPGTGWIDAMLPGSGPAIHFNPALPPDPFDQLVELDRLLGRGQRVACPEI